MQTVTVSPKYQVVIPKAVREALHLRPGQRMQVVEYDGRIELIPERDIKELRGFLKGINTDLLPRVAQDNLLKLYKLPHKHPCFGPISIFLGVKRGLFN